MQAVTRQYLALLQAHAYESLGQLGPATPPVDEFLKMFDQSTPVLYPQMPAGQVATQRAAYKAEIEKAIASTPTKFEDPMTYMLMSGLSRDIEAIIRKLKVPLSGRPAVGTLPTGSVNAITFQVPMSTQRLVVFEAQLFTFALLISKAVAQILPVESTPDGGTKISADPKHVDALLKANPDAARRFADVVLNYILVGQPAAAEPYMPEAKHLIIGNLMRDSMEMFVLGHEYGHILNDHWSTAAQSQSFLSEFGATTLHPNWEEEYVADSFGVMLGIAATSETRKVDGPIAYCGADLFFSADEKVRAGISLLEYGDEAHVHINSHPPAYLRRQNLHGALPQIFDADAAAAMIQLGSSLAHAIDQLWSITRPIVLQMRADGARPAASWRADEMIDATLAGHDQQAS
jgi:hypothetical protein